MTATPTPGDLSARLQAWLLRHDLNDARSTETRALVSEAAAALSALPAGGGEAERLLREYRAAPKFSHDHAAIKRTVALEDEIDAFLATTPPPDAAVGAQGVWVLEGTEKVPVGKRPRTINDHPLMPPEVTEWETRYHWRATVRAMTTEPNPPAAAPADVGAQGEEVDEALLADLGAGWTVVRDWLGYVIVRDAGGRDVIKSLAGNDEAEFVMHIIRRLAAPAAGKGVDDAWRSIVYAALRSIRYNANNGSQDRPQHQRLHLIGVEAERAIAALEAALTRQPVAGDGWRPIESAPKDAAVLVTFDQEDIEGSKSMPGFMVAYWDAYYAPGGAGYDGRGDGWTDASSGEQCHLHYGYPTHWQPIPAPPAAASDGEGE